MAGREGQAVRAAGAGHDPPCVHGRRPALHRRSGLQGEVVRLALVAIIIIVVVVVVVVVSAVSLVPPLTLLCPIARSRALSLCACVCSNFAFAFQFAATATEARYTMDGFDACAMEIEQDDILRFTDFLQTKLA